MRCSKQKKQGDIVHYRCRPDRENGSDWSPQEKQGLSIASSDLKMPGDMVGTHYNISSRPICFIYW